MEAFKVSGCGVSVICYDKASVLKWTAYIVQRGGIPTVNKLTQEELNAWVQEESPKTNFDGTPHVND
jgi:hypothetical protein